MDNFIRITTTQGFILLLNLNFILYYSVNDKMLHLSDDLCYGLDGESHEKLLAKLEGGINR